MPVVATAYQAATSELSAPSRAVGVLVAAVRGRVGIRADDSLNRYDPATGSFTQYRSPNEARGTVAISHDITEDQDGVIWLATDDGVTALDPVTSKTTCHRPRYTPSVGETRVIATVPLNDGTLWVTAAHCARTRRH